MKIIFLGDSITQGIGVADPKDCFTEILKRELPCELLNAGMGSTRIARSRTQWTEPHWHTLDFNARAEVLPEECDYCFVFGGTNDFGDGDAPIGKPTDTGYDTFSGAVNILAEKMQKKYGDRLVFLIPCHRINEEPHKAACSDRTVATFPEFIAAMKGILEEKGIPYIDLYEAPGLPRPVTRENTGAFRDGLHPNEAGHRVIADAVMEWIRAREA